MMEMLATIAGRTFSHTTLWRHVHCTSFACMTISAIIQWPVILVIKIIIINQVAPDSVQLQNVLF